MDEARVTNALSETRTLFGPPDQVLTAFMKASPLPKTSWWPTPGDPALALLVDVLSTEPDLAIFDRGGHFLWSAGFPVPREEVARWLVRRALIVGAAKATSNLAKFLAAPGIDAVDFLAFGGVLVPAGSTAFFADIAVVPFEELPDSTAKQTLSERSPSDQPTAALGLLSYSSAIR
jgi:hypothetical protein